MKISLVRHGKVGKQTAVYGTLDVPLSPKAFAGKLPPQLIDVPKRIYSSPSTRAIQTACWLTGLAAGDAGIMRDARLEERRLGVLEGAALGEANIPAYWAVDPDLRPEGGENFDDFATRIAGFLTELLEHGSDCLCVCHGGVLRAAIYHLLAVPLASVSKLTFEPLSGISITFGANGSVDAVELGQPFWRQADATTGPGTTPRPAA
jgi:broad specificity phosphatase PhoE